MPDLILANKKRFQESTDKYKEVVSKSKALVQQLPIYYGMETGELIITKFIEIAKKWGAISARMQSLIWSDKTLEEKITEWKKFEKEINSLVKDAEKSEGIIRQELSKIIYKAD